MTSSRVGHQIIHPYTDLLLHDMGEGLADKRQIFKPTVRVENATLMGYG